LLPRWMDMRGCGCRLGPALLVVEAVPVGIGNAPGVGFV
jgi:hypothetical protein